MDRPSLKERFQYWLDTRISKGTGSMVKILAVVTVSVVLLLSFLVVIFNPRGGDSPFKIAWDIFATTVNAWIPSDGDGDGSKAYLIFGMIGALVGLLFTSILIGVVSTSIEEKLNSLRRGNSVVVEQNHIVILGFRPGEYALIQQLVMAQADKPACLVIAEDMEREEMERLIHENIDIPDNVKVICRNANICDPNSLHICRIPDSKAVVINMIKDAQTTKALLAVSILMEQEGPDRQPIPIISAVKQAKYLFPSGMQEHSALTMLHAGNMLYRLIAHSCTQPGLSDAFSDIFSFEGSHLHLTSNPAWVGCSFGNLVGQMDGGMPPVPSG